MKKNLYFNDLIQTKADEINLGTCCMHSGPLSTQKPTI